MEQLLLGGKFAAKLSEIFQHEQLRLAKLFAPGVDGAVIDLLGVLPCKFGGGQAYDTRLLSPLEPLFGEPSDQVRLTRAGGAVQNQRAEQRTFLQRTLMRRRVCAVVGSAFIGRRLIRRNSVGSSAAKALFQYALDRDQRK